MSRIEDAMEKLAGDTGVEKPSVKVPGDVEKPPKRPARRSPSKGDVDRHIVAFHQPLSGLTENFKHIRVVIQNMLPEGSNKVVMFTSANRGEGKTMSSLNFAAAVAHDTSRRIVIVDADMRDPHIHEVLGIKAHRGFGDLLTTDAPAASAVVHTPIPGLSAVLCGERPERPAELLGTERARQIFLDLKRQFDMVVVDTPPVLPVSDTVNMASFADGVIIIVEEARTSRKKVERAVHLLNNANASVMGFLLNKSQGGGDEYEKSRYSYSRSSA